MRLFVDERFPQISPLISLASDMMRFIRCASDGATGFLS